MWKHPAEPFCLRLPSSSWKQRSPAWTSSDVTKLPPMPTWRSTCLSRSRRWLVRHPMPPRMTRRPARPIGDWVPERWFEQVKRNMA
jgi:hypothetical protein